MKKLLLFFLVLNIFFLGTIADAMPVRLKDIGKMIEERDNQLMGFGLVVGLRRTGDSKATVFTEVALTNMLKRFGISPPGKGFSSRNVAAVIVSASLPPFIKKGQRLPVIISAIGDSTNLTGGTLLTTSLKGPDMKVYAVAQGPVIVGGISGSSAQYTFFKNQTTVGRIPNGAIVEAEVPVTFRDQHNITFVLNDSNYITVSRTTAAIRKHGFPGATAIDANTIKIPLADLQSTDLIDTLAKLENIPVEPDSSAKIVINSRTGTIVIGEMVRLFPVALTHGSVSLKISEVGVGGFGAPAQATTEKPVTLEENESKILYLNPSTTLSSLVNALNEIGATPKDLISIIQALKESGALIANLEII
ncbi:flagellar basal body P-ring protein FlgI [Candidatus Margulisiibacteriota bacterium]